MCPASASADVRRRWTPKSLGGACSAAMSTPRRVGSLRTSISPTGAHVRQRTSRNEPEPVWQIRARRLLSMGQAVYVLTALQNLEGKKATREWRPVGVVTNLDLAEKWAASGSNNDWIPFELDDPAGQEGEYTSFQPKTPLPNEQKAVEVAKRLESANQRLLKIIEQLQQQLEKKKRGA